MRSLLPGQRQQDELWRQKDRFDTDFISRSLGVILTCALCTLYIPGTIILAIYAVVIASEFVTALTFRRLRRAPNMPAYVILLLTCWIGFCAFSFLGVLISTVEQPAATFTATLSLVGALISVSSVRAEHLPIGIISGVPPSVALLWIAARDWPPGEGFGVTAVATIAAIGLIGYFGSTLLQNHATQSGLARALNRASSASSAKSRFLSEMNHDMRTPLNTIIGLSRTISEHARETEVADQADEIESAARNLQTLIEDVLDLAAAEEGQSSFRPVTTVIRHELQAVARILATGNADRRVPLVIVESDVPELVRIDPLLLRKCLVRAAGLVAAGPDGPPLQPASLRCQRSAPGALTLRITIDGTPAAEPRSGEASLPMRPNGFLASEIVSSMARRMHGTIRTPSGNPGTPGVELTLRYERVADLPTRSKATASVPLRALVVDDLSTNRFVVAHMLKTLAIDVIEAESGSSALAELGRTPVDLVLLDMNMPAMNGEQTFRAIRGAGQPWSAVPIIALTADAQSEQRDRYLSLGLDGYVSKPIDDRLLWAEIVAAVPRSSGNGR